MKIRVDKMELIDAMSTASYAIQKPPVIPASAYVKVTVNREKETMYLEGTSATANAVTMIKDIDCDTDVSFLLDPKFIMDAARKCDGPDIEISKAEDIPMIQVKLGKSKFKVNTVDVKNFPRYNRINPNDNTVEFSLPYSDLADMQKNIGYAVSHKDARPILCGVNIASDGNVLRCCATDSYRLGRKVYDIPVPSFCVTVPQKALDNAVSIFKGDEKIQVRVSNNRVSFANEKAVYTSSLLEGNFPDVERHIPNESAFTTKVTVNRNELLGMMERATLFYSASDMPSIKININNDVFSVFCKNAEIGNYDEQLEEKFEVDGVKDVSFAVDTTFMRDALKSISDDKIVLNVVGELKPIIVYGAKTGNKHIALVLPMKTFD